MRVTLGALIRAQVKTVVATLHARTHRRMQRLQKEVTAQRRTIRRPGTAAEGLDVPHGEFTCSSGRGWRRDPCRAQAGGPLTASFR